MTCSSQCSEVRQSKTRLKNSTKRDKITKKVTIRLEIPLYEKIEKKAIKKGKTVSKYLLEVIKQNT